MGDFMKSRHFLLLTVIAFALLLLVGCAATPCGDDSDGNVKMQDSSQATLVYSSFDGGGPEYTVTIEDDSIASYTQYHRYPEEESGEIEGSGYDVVLEFTGQKPGETEVTVSARSSIAENFDESFLVRVDENLNVKLEQQSYKDVY